MTITIDHIHFYVEDAQTLQNWFINCLGFEDITEEFTVPVFHRSENEQQILTKVVRSGYIDFVISSPLSSCNKVAKFLKQHPPGVADVAFRVEDIKTVIKKIRTVGSEIFQPVESYRNGQEIIQYALIAGWGGITHTLIQKDSVAEFFIPSPPGDRRCSSVSYKANPIATCTAIDHVVLNVEKGELKPAVAWYQKVLDFLPQQSFNINTENSALNSQVLTSSDGRVQFPINEPASNNSQIQEFINFNRGAGIQHIALQVNNIVSSIIRFRGNGLSFLPVTPEYYLYTQQRKGFSIPKIELNAIEKQQILVDWNEKNPEAQLLQIFTQPIFAEPTFFLEFIERRSCAEGFGEGNFRALFKVMEEEQMKRASNW
ncbi:MAG: 4-hydroxyphenylpyruvate dioxygenase [Cyanobacteria bacterium P01_A01_bin.45]